MEEVQENAAAAQPSLLGGGQRAPTALWLRPVVRVPEEAGPRSSLELGVPRPFRRAFNLIIPPLQKKLSLKCHLTSS